MSKTDNPLVVEYRRSGQLAWLMAVSISLVVAVSGMLLQHQLQVERRTQLLNLIGQDFVHQLQPFQQGLQRLQQQALQSQLSLLTPTDFQHIALKDNATPFTSEELAMIATWQQSMPVIRQHVPGIVRLGYLSMAGRWMDSEPQQVLNQTELASMVGPLLKPAVAVQTSFSWAMPDIQSGLVLAIPVRGRAGYLVMQLDVMRLFKGVNTFEVAADLMLMSEQGEVLLAIKDGVASEVAFDGLHETDTFNPLPELPYTLHIQPNSGLELTNNLLWFLGLFLLQIGCYGSLIIYLRYRFKKRVLGPFARWQTHRGRLKRGEQGVRNIPEGWAHLFQQTTNDVAKTKVAE